MENPTSQGNNYGNKHPYEGQKLPADPLALTLGIVSLVIFLVLCWCYGVIAIITLILGIIGLVQANRSLKIYRSNPDKYSQATFRSVQNGRILNIISVVLSSLVTIGFLILALFFGSIFYSIMDGDWENIGNPDQFEQRIYGEDDGVLEESTDDWIYEDDIEDIDAEPDTLSTPEPPEEVIFDN
ncbi:hypothetical protein BST97_10590 [Nonlabens spongiae]|uniref:DUF4190 domain-containing protein n=1 Tax=Nonlabens spongiae TaxID=331648 RepID=A0A1W6MLE7_9FLAO|nr:CCC motif membrane protein [Nonlabens spongiae]ARN78397.1 hypothetical protein BST97_10590 [Nonlabens spongiae]